MGGYAAALMLGVVDAVQDELPGVVTVEPVIDGVAVTACVHQASESQFRKMLRHRSRRFTDRRREFAHGHLAVEQAPQQCQPGSIRQHPEHLDREVDFVG